VAEPWTILRVLEWTTQRFAQGGPASPRLDAELLLSHVLACPRIELYTSFDKPLGETELGAFRSLVKRRLAGEPVAYLRGVQEFFSLPFQVDSRVLVPRPETETLVEVVLAVVRGDANASTSAGVGSSARPVRVADIGTGSGALAVVLARELPGATVVATDVSEAALAVAGANAVAHGVAARIELRVGHLLEPLAGAGPFDLLVANLPYVRTDELVGLAPEVRTEPRLALDGGVDGLALLAPLIAGAPAVLRPGGLLVLEHGWDQAEAIAGLIVRAGGLTEAVTQRDLAGHARVTSARKAG
jgi:release factor glutamine methyltransferase